MLSNQRFFSAGLSINAATGELYGNLRPIYADGDVFGYTVKIVATDPSGASAEGGFWVSVNAAPNAAYIPNQSIRAGKVWDYYFPVFNDVNGDALTYTVTGLPAGLSHMGGNRIYGTPTAPGTYTVTVTANRGGTASSSFTLTVKANNVPTAPAVGNSTGTVGIAYNYVLPAFGDADGDPLAYAVANLPPGLWFDAGSRLISGTPTENRGQSRLF